MELIFYDQSGKPVAYTDDGEHIYTYDGDPVAYLSGDSVYGYNGRHLGWLMNGWMWDHGGGAVFFTKNAQGGPLKPLASLTPMKSLKSLAPLKSLRSLAPLRPMKSLSWSQLSGTLFFAQ